MNFLHKDIDDYCTAHSQGESDLLHQLFRETYQKVLQPRMLSGRFQGRLLALISKLIQPNQILEIGTYTGYSALCLAEGLTPTGQLITIDKNEELEDIVTKYVKLSPFENKIKMIIGNALDIIPTLPISPDLVFIDADKSNYQNYFDLVVEKMPSGGVILADNVLWSGKVVHPAKDKDEDTLGLQEFNQAILTDPRVENILLPIRDGLNLIRKK